MPQISVDDLKTRFHESMEKASDFKTNPATQQFVLFDQLRFGLENYDSMSAEAQKMTNKLKEDILSFMEENMKVLPDSPIKRTIGRHMRGAKGERVHVSSHLKKLASPFELTQAFQKKCDEIFEKRMQLIVDFYQEVMGRKNGAADFAKLGLLSGCIDELLVAYFLVQKNYPLQAFSHIRTCQEGLDLIALFNKEPRLSDEWAGDENTYEIWKKYKRLVKDKLSRNKAREDIEGLLSNHGVHPTFDMLKVRCKMLKNKEDGRTQFLVSIGGTPNTREVFSSHVILLYTVLMLMGELVASFSQLLNVEEVKKELSDACKEFTNFFAEFIIKPFIKDGKQYESVKQDLDKSLQKLLDSL